MKKIGDSRTARTSPLMLGVILLSFVLLTVIAWRFLIGPSRLQQRYKRNVHLVQQLVTSEEILLELTPKLGLLSRSLKNLQLPTSQARPIFADDVSVSGQLEETAADQSSDRATIQWSIADGAESFPRQRLELWPALIHKVNFFEHVKFYFIRGELNPKDSSEFLSTVGFAGLAQLRNSSTQSSSVKTDLHGQLEIRWRKSSNPPKPDAGLASAWEISHWKLTDFESVQTPQLMFRDVLPEVLQSREMLTKATISKHTSITSDLMAGRDYIFPPGEKYFLFFPDVTLEHPGIAVVDIDGDGLDDIYVAMQHGANLLFRNRGDGTFEEQAAKYGLNIVGGSTSAIFADFDNDGDQDVFLGRARRNSLYFVNEDGYFVDQTQQRIDGALPALVSSISATDFNNDGLLDLYLCTYSPIEESNRFQVSNKPAWVDLFLTPKQGKEFAIRNKKSNRFINRAGPPNLLLKNIGQGKFQPAQENETLQLWRMSFQGSWNDFDLDGDQDLYVANDYGPDNFFRNDRAAGFTDITRSVGLTGMGFGMGVSWGDYDNDGQTDLYVSNMYSKAGQRITSQVENLDPRLREMAQGNFLYRFEDGNFSMVAGADKSKLDVAKSGWSWGGQFFDFNNDGFRDLYATSGYYTAPKDIAVDLDL